MSDTKTEIKKSPAILFDDEIKSAVAGSSDAVRTLVKEKFVKEEVNRRADLLAQLFTAIGNYRKEGFKLKPDQKSLNAAGEVVAETWSPAQHDKRKKFDEKLVKAESAFHEALMSNKFDGLQEIINSLKVEKKESGKSEEKSE